MESAASALGGNGSRKFANTGKQRNFFATASLPDCHSRLKVQAAFEPPGTWEPLGTVLQRLLAKWERTHRRD